MLRLRPPTECVIVDANVRPTQYIALRNEYPREHPISDLGDRFTDLMTTSTLPLVSMNESFDIPSGDVGSVIELHVGLRDRYD